MRGNARRSPAANWSTEDIEDYGAPPEEIVGYNIPVVVPPERRAEAERVLPLLESLCRPAPGELLVTELHRLSTLTARRSGARIDVAAIGKAYVEELRAYPADIAVAAMRNWTKPSNPDAKWFPTGAELAAVCEKLFAERRLLVEAVRRTVQAGSTPPPRPEPGIDLEAEAKAAGGGTAGVMAALGRRAGMSKEETAAMTAPALAYMKAMTDWQNTPKHRRGPMPKPNYIPTLDEVRAALERKDQDGGQGQAL